MEKKLPAFYFLISFLVFWGISLVFMPKTNELYFYNFIAGGILINLFNPLNLKGKFRLFAIVVFLISVLVCFFLPLQRWYAWLFLWLFVLYSGFKKFSLSITEGTRVIIWTAGFFLLSFVSATKINDVQYDFDSCYNYIEYILENNFMFWHENPLLTRPSYSSYHPILHFFFGALGIRFGEEIGFYKNIASEAVQILFVAYMFWYGIICAKILTLFKLSRGVFFSLLAFIVFFPLYRPISGFFNNDCLLLPLQAGTIYYSLLYYFEGNKKNLFFIFVFATLACLTKLSGILVLPMTGVIFLMKLYQERTKNILIEQIVFGVFLILGISIWPIYQYFVLHIGFDYVPPQAHLPLDGYTLWERFSPFGAFFYDKMFYNDFGINLWETMTKTALFGQWDFSWRGGIIMPFIGLMVLCYKLIIAILEISIVYLLIKQWRNKTFVISLVLVCSLLLGQVLFGLKHPYMCNQDFRYVAILPLGFSLILLHIIPFIKPWAKNIVLLLLNLFSFLALFVWQWVIV